MGEKTGLFFAGAAIPVLLYCLVHVLTGGAGIELTQCQSAKVDLTQKLQACELKLADAEGRTTIRVEKGMRQ